MRIAIVTHKVGFQDGQGRVNYEIAKAVLNRGDFLTVVGESCAEEIAKHPHASFVGMQDRVLPTQMLRDQYFAAKSARWLRAHRHEFDLVQANGFVTWEPADIVAVHYVHSAWLRNLHYPFRWSSFSPYAYYQRANTLLNCRLEKRAFRAARKIVAVSRATAEEVKSLALEAAKVEVVHNGVDTDEFCPGPSARSEFGLPSHVPMAMFAGDIRTPRKNLETVLEAMQTVRELHLAVAGSIVGSPYPALARRLGVSERVHFLGKTARIVDLMRSVDFFIFPSFYEPFGLAPLEAIATGIPVVMSQVVGAADSISGGGIVFGAPSDVPALAAAMQELINHPERRKVLGKAGRSIALSMQWSHTAAGYLKIYDDMMREKSAAGQPPSGDQTRP